MPNVETMLMRQDAVVWPFVGYDAQGDPLVGKPITLKVRHSYSRRESLDPMGRVQALDAEMIVDRDIPIDSLVFLGRLRDYTDDSEKMIVKTRSITPDIHTYRTKRTMGLMRYNSAVVVVTT